MLKHTLILLLFFTQFYKLGSKKDFMELYLNRLFIAGWVFCVRENFKIYDGI